MQKFQILLAGLMLVLAVQFVAANEANRPDIQGFEPTNELEDDENPEGDGGITDGFHAITGGKLRHNFGRKDPLEGEIDKFVETRNDRFPKCNKRLSASACKNCCKDEYQMSSVSKAGVFNGKCACAERVVPFSVATSDQLRKQAEINKLRQAQNEQSE